MRLRVRVNFFLTTLTKNLHKSDRLSVFELSNANDLSTASTTVVVLGRVLGMLKVFVLISTYLDSAGVPPVAAAAVANEIGVSSTFEYCEGAKVFASSDTCTTVTSSTYVVCPESLTPLFF